ncbi:hypothetical protein ACFL46_02250 [Candidatus Neomarinimicrobiota bacterium]
MTRESSQFKGILKLENDTSFILDDNGQRIFGNELIWNGYISHWKDKQVHAQYLSQHDYDHEKPIIIIWPVETNPTEPFVELYYNERLVKYRASLFGHTAINVNGKIFNFSHLINENEIMSKAEYFYRPALGEFAPSPRTGQIEIKTDGRSYFDKFGRNFMRTIHVVRIKGIDPTVLLDILMEQLNIIHRTSIDPDNPAKYSDFNFFSRNCATIIRDSLNRFGYDKIKGIFPRDLFINAAHFFQFKSGLDVNIFKMPQLLVSEAEPSGMTPLLNIKNWHKVMRLKYTS